MTTAPHSSEHNPLSDKENLGPPATPPPPPPLRRKIDKLTVSSEASLASFTPVSPLYDITQPEGEEGEGEREGGRERQKNGGKVGLTIFNILKKVE